MQETSYLSYGFAQSPHRRLKRKRKAIRESVDGLKQYIAGSRPALKHFITLSDEYKKDPQLGSTQARVAMEAILKSLFDAGRPEVASTYGAVEFKADQQAWIAFFDGIGDQTLAQFLGIESTAEIPGADMDARADEIIADSGVDEPPPDEPEKILASKPDRVSALKERMRRHSLAQNHMSRYLPHRSR